MTPFDGRAAGVEESGEAAVVKVSVLLLKTKLKVCPATVSAWVTTSINTHFAPGVGSMLLVCIPNKAGFPAKKCFRRGGLDCYHKSENKTGRQKDKGQLKTMVSPYRSGVDFIIGDGHLDIPQKKFISANHILT